MGTYKRCKYCQQLSKRLSYVVHSNGAKHLILRCPCRPSVMQYREFVEGLDIPVELTKKQLKGQQPLPKQERLV